MPFENFGILPFLARYLKNHFSYCLDTWQADREWWVDDMINFWKNSRIFFLSYLPFENLGILTL